MSQSGDDCYFYYYSTCVKGDACPFRHQPAARNCEITCDLWEKGRCFKKACTFRHMVIEKDRGTIPCVWENQPSGCIKPYCPFLHTKPRNIPTSRAHPRVHPSQSAINAPPGNIASATQNIPTLGGNPRTSHVRPMHPQGHPGMGRAGSHMYNGPPRMNMGPNQGPYVGGPRPMQQRPMGYEVSYMSGGQPSHPLMYQMHHNNQLHMAQMPQYGGMIPGMLPNMGMTKQRGDYHRTTGSDYDDSEDEFTSSDFSDVSISDDDRKAKARSNSRRKVQSPRHVRSRREVRQRSDRNKRSESKSSHTERKSTRRRHERDDREREENEREEREKDEREKERSRKESDKSKSKPRKHSEEKESSSEKKRSQSPSDTTKSEPEEQKDDIKVKTLEEILREKALKNLHERTAQKKKAQREAEKGSKEGTDDNKSDSPEPILKSVVSVSKTESTSSQREPQVSEDDADKNDNDDDDEEVQFVRETKFRSPKTIIRSIIDPDNESQHTSAPVSKTIRKIKEVESNKTAKENSSENKEEKSEDKSSKDSSLNTTASDLSKIKIKTFEEIMEEKRQRKTQKQQQPSHQDQIVANAESKMQDTNTDEKPVKNRKIRVIKKATESVGNKEIKADTGKLIVRRNVKASPKKGIINKEVPKQPIQEEKTKENKKNTDIKKVDPTNIVIKSFDEIIREKRQRQQETFQPEPQQSTKESAITTVKKPSIIRKKLAINKPVEKTQVEPRAFKSRKLKVVSRQGLSTKSNEIDSEPASPTNPKIQTVAEPSSHQLTAQSSNTDRETSSKVTQGDNSRYNSAATTTADDGSDDDDSWEHEELPAVPLETPTLDGPAEIPDIPNEKPQAAAVFQFPSETTKSNSTVTNSISPPKRPRSSLEEIFGVPCHETHPKLEKSQELSDEDDKDVSPAKRAKTIQEVDHDEDKEIIKHERSKTDDFDFELEEEIANLSPDRHYDTHDTLNEDDLLLELEEMIND